MDKAVSERTAIVDHVSVFTDCPVESNDLQWRDMDNSLTGLRPGFFWLLRRVYHDLLRGRTRRNVGPVPASSLDQKALDCADSSSRHLPRKADPCQGAEGCEYAAGGGCRGR